jgi:pyrroline-5-carboxylate reductase
MIAAFMCVVYRTAIRSARGRVRPTSRVPIAGIEGSRVIGIVGVGAIAEAIVTGLCAGDDAPTVRLSPRSASRTDRLAARYPSVTVADSNQAVLDESDVVLLCVRPQDAPGVISGLTFGPRHAVVSVLAGVSLDALGRLVAPAGIVVRAIPLPAVATRTGLTAIHPPHEIARAIFDPLGGVIALDEEHALDALSASTGTIAAHIAYLDTISRWLIARGIPEADATRYVAAVFAPILATPPDDFGTLAEDYATAGGLNEQFLATLRDAGMLDVVDRALDAIAQRLERPATG